MYLSDDHASKVTHEISAFQSRGFLTNLSVYGTTDKEAVKCHKVVLIAMGDRFRQIFAFSDELKTPETTANLRDLMRYIYIGRVYISDCNAADFLCLSLYFKLHQLTEHCLDWIKNNLTIRNVFMYHSVQYGPLSVITGKYLKNNCTQLLPTGKLKRWEINDMKKLLTAFITEDFIEDHIKLDVILPLLTTHTYYEEIAYYEESAELLSAIKWNKLNIDCLKIINDNPALLEQKHKVLIQELLNVKYEEELVKQQKTIVKQKRKRKQGGRRGRKKPNRH